MPRKPRDVGEGIHHVWVNVTGNGRYFEDDADRLTWIRYLVHVLDVHRCSCVAFCQMTTHVHLLLDVRRGVLPDVMRDLNREYAKEFNARHDRLGALDRKRYGSRRACSDEDLLGLFAYVVLNPVRERMCARAEEWPWSSYLTTLGFVRAFGFVDATIVVAAAGGQASLRRFVARQAMSNA
jgi:putative transposase